MLCSVPSVVNEPEASDALETSSSSKGDFATAVHGLRNKRTDHMSCKPLSVFARGFFAPIFAVCFAMHCGAKPGKEPGGAALHSSILDIAEISEFERDELIIQLSDFREKKTVD